MRALWADSCWQVTYEHWFYWVIRHIGVTWHLIKPTRSGDKCFSCGVEQKEPAFLDNPFGALPRLEYVYKTPQHLYVFFGAQEREEGVAILSHYLQDHNRVNKFRFFGCRCLHIVLFHALSKTAPLFPGCLLPKSVYPPHHPIPCILGLARSILLVSLLSRSISSLTTPHP